jgi:hypothetical protein
MRCRDRSVAYASCILHSLDSFLIQAIITGETDHSSWILQPFYNTSIVIINEYILVRENHQRIEEDTVKKGLIFGKVVICFY